MRVWSSTTLRKRLEKMGLLAIKQSKLLATIIVPAIVLLTVLQFMAVGRQQISSANSTSSESSSFWGLVPKDVWLDYSNKFAGVVGNQMMESNNTASSFAQPETEPVHKEVPTSPTPPISPALEGLPKWIQDYVTWHNFMRSKYPGTKLFTDPDAPNVILRTCVAKCGGLHDRLGKLPWDLYIANQTNRVLLISWCFPAPLETFLEPNIIDWSFPQRQEGDDPIPGWDKPTCYENANSVPKLFKGHNDARHGSKFYEEGIEPSFERANTDPEVKNTKILQHRILGLDTELAKRLKALGETDTIVATTENGSLPSYGRIFTLFFKPSSGLQAELEATMHQHNLFPGEYSAVHCRVRHPKAYPRGTLGKIDAPGGPDRVGLLFDGPGKDYAIDTATKAIQCAQNSFLRPNEPIYFYADSEDLVRYMTSLTDDAKKRRIRRSPNVTKTEIAAMAATSNTVLISRPITTETLHIDRQVAADPAMFYGSFVDLLIGAHARCVAYGVGNYAYFAAKLSGTSCGYLHQKGAWDAYDEEKTANSKLCKK